MKLQTTTELYLLLAGGERCNNFWDRTVEARISGLQELKVMLDRAQLTFPPQASMTSSTAAQLLTPVSSAELSAAISGIEATGDLTQTNDCGSSLSEVHIRPAEF
jgi:hypothetical protein